MSWLFQIPFAHFKLTGAVCILSKVLETEIYHCSYDFKYCNKKSE